MQRRTKRRHILLFTFPKLTSGGMRKNTERRAQTYELTDFSEQRLQRGFEMKWIPANTCKHNQEGLTLIMEIQSKTLMEKMKSHWMNAKMLMLASLAC